MTKRNAGVTLIELLITIVVFTVVISMAVPGFTSFIHSNRTSGAANTLVTALTFARSEAVRRSETVRICPFNGDVANPACQGTDWSQGWVVQVLTGANANEVVRIWSPVSNQVELSLAADGTGVTASNLDFLPLGNVVGGGSFQYVWELEPVNCRVGRPHKRLVDVNVTGRPQVLVEDCE